MSKYALKALGAAGTVLQWGCVTHCAFEYIGDIVVVITAMCDYSDVQEFEGNAICTAGVCTIKNGFCFLPIKCTGPSMEPTIFSNDVLFAEHLSSRFKNFSKGDIIIAKCPSNPRQHICKRITGLPGDKVRYGFTTYVVPEGHVWLEGDNSSSSADSRIYGAVPQGLLRGRAVCKIWPFSDVTLLTPKHVEHD